MQKKRPTPEKKREIQNVLESYRRFDYDYIAFGNNWIIPDGAYPYRKHSRMGIVSFVLRLLMGTAGILLNKIAYGARVVGKKNLKAIGKRGAISVINHFSYLDTLFVRQAVGNFRSYHTMAPWNNKKGLGGWFIRHAGMLSFSPDFAATRNLTREMERLLKEGKIVNFYAEQAMWQNYQKPRPMKDGAFFYADKFDVPVLPVFCTFRRNARGHMSKLRIHILPPIELDKTLPKKERIARAKAQAEGAWRECYEQAYGKPLEYLPDRRKHGNG